MNFIARGLAVFSVAVCALSVGSKAQVVVLNGAGSSGLWAELGQAVQGNPVTAVCLFTSQSAGVFNVHLTDGTSGVTLNDNGNAWIAWTPGGGPDCAHPGVSSQIFEYVDIDSVVGIRCLFNANAPTNPCRIVNTFPTSGTPAPTAHVIYPTTGDSQGNETAVMPFPIAAALSAATVPTFAPTDIRPEDARFASYRATLDVPLGGTGACGQAITQYTAAGDPTQYLSLGYTNGSRINSFTGGSLNVIDFTLPTTFFVTPIGVAPVIIVVNAPPVGVSGFGNPLITNITHSTLALYLDGTIGQTRDALPPSAILSADATMANVWVREPLSGAYNTVEFTIPNSVELKTSQDVGVKQVDISNRLANGNFNSNCNATHTAPSSNGTPIPTVQGNLKGRALSTSQELVDVLSNPNSIGYVLWSKPNLGLAATVGRARYLSVDGIDPLGTGGAIPTVPTQLSNVTMANVANGSYPIWSLLRLVTLNPTEEAAAQRLAESMQIFVSAMNPDLIPFSNSAHPAIPDLGMERSHFTPPGIYPVPSSAPTPQNVVNVSSGAALFTEVGGDVGGVPLSYQTDTDYCFGYSSSTSTCAPGNSFTGTVAPSPDRRQ